MKSREFQIDLGRTWPSTRSHVDEMSRSHCEIDLHSRLKSWMECTYIRAPTSGTLCPVINRVMLALQNRSRVILGKGMFPHR